MTYKITIIPEAKSEFRKAKQWYENQSPGLGEKFSEEAKKAIRTLSNPQVDHKLVFTTNRRMLLSKFPYTIYYKRDEKNFIVKVMAILHNKQSRDMIQNRL
jgi:plasmid stabilization system protein ParE